MRSRRERDRNRGKIRKDIDGKDRRDRDRTRLKLVKDDRERSRCREKTWMKQINREKLDEANRFEINQDYG